MSDNTQFAWPDDEKNHYRAPNPYYEPEACGLETICTLEDDDACYSYDTVVLWREKSTGKFYAAHDSGCSCPTPFEEYRSLGDLTHIASMDDLRGLVGPNNKYVKWDTAAFYEAARSAGLR